MSKLKSCTKPTAWLNIVSGGIISDEEKNESFAYTHSYAVALYTEEELDELLDERLNEISGQAGALEHLSNGIALMERSEPFYSKVLKSAKKMLLASRYAYSKLADKYAGSQKTVESLQYAISKSNTIIESMREEIAKLRRTREVTDIAVRALYEHRKEGILTRVPATINRVDRDLKGLVIMLSPEPAITKEVTVREVVREPGEFMGWFIPHTQSYVHRTSVIDSDGDYQVPRSWIRMFREICGKS